MLSAAILSFQVSLTSRIASQYAGASDFQRSPILFIHESPGRPELAELRRHFSFDECLRQGNTEFDRMALLKNWVYWHLRYGKNFDDQNLANSIAILKRSARGDSFLCTNYCIVFLQTALSMGWTARYIYLRKPTGQQHAGNDIWSNQYRKWIYIDPTWNIHLEKNGIPQSALEIRSEWNRNGGRSLVFVFGAGGRSVRYQWSHLPVVRRERKIWEEFPLDAEWPGYFYQVGVLGRNDFFSFQGNRFKLMYIIKDDINREDDEWDFRNKTAVEDLRCLFHNLNYVDIRMKSIIRKGKRLIRVDLSTQGKYAYTPHFRKFLVKIDNQEWRVMPARFIIAPDAERRVIRARIVNNQGVRGPIYTRTVPAR